MLGLVLAPCSCDVGTIFVQCWRPFHLMLALAYVPSSFGVGIIFVCYGHHLRVMLAPCSFDCGPLVVLSSRPTFELKFFRGRPEWLPFAYRTEALFLFPCKNVKVRQHKMAFTIVFPNTETNIILLRVSYIHKRAGTTRLYTYINIV